MPDTQTKKPQALPVGPTTVSITDPNRYYTDDGILCDDVTVVEALECAIDHPLRLRDLKHLTVNVHQPETAGKSAYERAVEAAHVGMHALQTALLYLDDADVSAEARRSLARINHLLDDA